MNKQLLTILAISLGIILIPAVVISLGLSHFIGGFWWILLIAAGVIFLIGEISNQYFQRRIAFDIVTYKTRIEELKNEQSITASCAYCKTRLTIPIMLSKRNTHECPECKQTNLVIFQFTTTQITTPLQLPQIGATPETGIK
jgi:Zn finger protein HypA/HybF involved in hydrogenase expression